MKSIKSILFFTFICCFTTIVFAQNITVDDAKTAQQLVENVLVNSSCANVLNIMVSGNTTTGQNSYGYFNNQGGSFPFKEGVLLSTWSSQNSIGPFRSDIGGTSSWAGDSDLEKALGLVLNSTENATSLEFDFIPLTNFVSFDYLFASNEYVEDFPCNHSDGFAFLIKEGSAAIYENLALIPETTTAVSSYNIHPAISSFKDSYGNQIDGCSAKNETYFGSLNTAITNTSPINYSGQTIKMKAQKAVTAGKTYHVKLVVADSDSKYWNSAVFLEAGSFIEEIKLVTDNPNPICFGNTTIIKTELTDPTNVYKWYKEGNLIPCSDSSCEVSDAGIYKVEVTFGSSTCSIKGEIKIEYTPEIVLSNTTLIQCDDNGDGITTFNLTKVDNIIINNDSSLSPVVYYESLLDAKGAINPILDPATYKNTTANQIVFARVTNTFGCANYAKVKLVILNNSIAPQNPVSTCDGDDNQDGLYHFDLNAQVTPQVLTGLPLGLVVEYYLNSSDAISQKSPLPNIFNNTTANRQIIYARIVNGPDCYGIVPITLIVNTFDPPNFQDETAFLCNGNTISLGVNIGFSSYLWNTGDTSSAIIVTKSGNYSVTVTNENGCKAVKKFTVSDSGIATITGVTINDFAGKESSVLIQYTGIGNYEFSLDGIHIQDNPLFTGIAPGNYIVSARDKNGCGGAIPFVIYVLDYPHFFTPNGDGYNDVWEIKNLDSFTQAIITIFDRYGKLLKQLDANSTGWDGKFNGHELPATDYWFNLTFGDGKVIKGHFSLKR